MLLDVSRPVAPRSQPWPGDVPFASERTWTLGRAGSGVNVCAVRTTTHIGTHVDAPWHFLEAGAPVDQLPLEAFVGPARVVEALGATGLVEPTPALLRQVHGAPRVLLRTRDRGDPYAYDAAYAAPSPALAEALVQRGVVLFGTDAPSVDVLPGLPSHKALARGGCQILEWLDLTRAPAGDYELLALPLRLEGLDASPVRAVLRRP